MRRYLFGFAICTLYSTGPAVILLPHPLGEIVARILIVIALIFGSGATGREALERNRKKRGGRWTIVGDIFALAGAVALMWLVLAGHPDWPYRTAGIIIATILSVGGLLLPGARLERSEDARNSPE